MRFTSDRHRTPIVDYLEREIGVAIDREFRGTVVAMRAILAKRPRRAPEAFCYNR